MPCHNSSTTIKEAVDSIFRQNLKTPFEIVIVDDGSHPDITLAKETLNWSLNVELKA